MSTSAHARKPVGEVERLAIPNVGSRQELSRGAGIGRIDAALAIIRAAVGVVFLAHGAQKVFVYGFAGVIGAFGGMGIPLAGVVGPAVALLELLGGAALITGVLTRWVSLALAANMLGALLLVHLPAGFFLPNGIEFVLVLLAASAGLALVGAGRFSVEGWLAARGNSRRELRVES